MAGLTTRTRLALRPLQSPKNAVLALDDLTARFEKPFSLPFALCLLPGRDYGYWDGEQLSNSSRHGTQRKLDQRGRWRVFLRGFLIKCPNN